MRRLSETVIADAVRQHFADLGWTLYFEVSLFGLAGRPDIVGVRGPLTLIVECKTSLSLALLAQVAQQRGRAHYVYAASPYSRSSAAMDYLRDRGIGWVSTSGISAVGEWGACTEHLAPRFNRRVVATWRDKLEPEHQTYCAPGSAGGGYWTPYAKTCREIQSFLRGRLNQRPPVEVATTKEVMAGIRHHYRSNATAASALLGWAVAEKIKGVRVEKVGKNYVWRLLPPTEPLY
jgi:hypothetical protein